MTTYQYLVGSHIWIKQTPQWNAVMETFSLPMFSDSQRGRLMQWVDLENRTVDWEAIHREALCFGPEQITLLRLAHALHQDGDCQLSELGQLSSAARSAAIMLIGLRYR
jgi:hypothetical protein